MPNNIIDFDAHRRKQAEASPQELLEQMSVLEELIEIMDELGVTTRAELVEMLEALDTMTPETLD